MRRASVAVCAAGAAVLFMAASSSSAQAAIGVFRYYDAQNISRSITNPAPAACLRTPGAVRAINNTDKPIELYSGADCRGLVHTVTSGEDFTGNFNSARDVS
jgi:hypothetical protein